MAVAIVLSQMSAIPVRIAKEHVLRPVQDGWQSLRQGMASTYFAVKKELLSVNLDEIEPFKIRLANVIEEERYTRHQLFNCDETGLNWKMLQDKTVADGSENGARGFKVSKE